MDSAPHRKAEGDTAVAQEILRNQAQALKNLQEAAEQQRSDYLKRMALLASSVFLGGAVFGALLYGYIRSRGAANGDNAEYTTQD